jgi:DNA-directed RNA polymerase subunit K/omega
MDYADFADTFVEDAENGDASDGEDPEEAAPDPEAGDSGSGSESEDDDGVDVVTETSETEAELNAVLEDEVFAPPGAPSRPTGATRKILPRSQYMCSDYLTAYEVAAVLATRATQIDKTGQVFTPPEKQVESSAEKRAMEELKAGCCPLIIWRQRSHGGQLVVEEWTVRELTLPAGIGY